MYLFEVLAATFLYAGQCPTPQRVVVYYNSSHESLFRRDEFHESHDGHESHKFLGYLGLAELGAPIYEIASIVREISRLSRIEAICLVSLR